ncbi:MAG: hypothetical protein EOM15_05360 [Spirochaetia bacterium]|nr:hypothetical protein [Spirochaetia bacterium]
MSIWSLLVVLVLAILVFVLVPSQVEARFKAIEAEVVQSQVGHEEVFTIKELEEYPQAIQKFFINMGFVGKPKMTGLKAYFPNTPFSLGQNKPTISIDYTQLNRADTPTRYAKISSRIYGLPFEGLDSFSEGKGSMEGYLAKFIRLFNQTGAYMDKACLVTYLAEAFFLPTVALSDSITYEEIDALTIKATISAYGIQASGIFTFAETGEMLSFVTNDRLAAGMDGTIEQIPWTAECSDYVMMDGMLVPSRLKAIWHYPEGDLVYFDGKDVQLTYF